MKNFLCIMLWTVFVLTNLFSQNMYIKIADSVLSVSKITSWAGATASLNNSPLLYTNDKDQERFIVELNETPRILINRNTSAAITRSINKATVYAEITKLRPSNIVNEFSEVISGFSFKGSREDVQKIKSLPGVKHVYKDLQVSSQPLSTGVTGYTPSSLLRKISTGKGVRVGVIDTGVDYMNEDFGKGFGANFTVVGGYDFVNNDSDPMDDNGHGTHVTGIIAASSTSFQGIANDAKIFAYKALDSYGQGYMSDVIRAIEKAVADSVKVINLSLSASGGDGDDLLSQSVNRVVESGIVVVASAGNSSDFGTIGSPGSAKMALTVGAIDNNKNIASFSSKGPVIKNYSIKPDVVAPGVGISSSKLGGGYISMSGTSMAAPMVTGIVAELIEVHPEWSALEIRNAVIEASEKIGSSIFSSGDGLPSPEKSAAIKTSVIPNALSFGFAVSDQSSWNAVDTLAIRNLSISSHSYLLKNTFPNGTSLTTEPSSFVLSPNAVQKVVVSLNANMNTIPNANSIQDASSGSISILSDADSITIPYVFFKGNILRLDFDEIPWQTVVIGENGFVNGFLPKSNSALLLLNPGTYDIITNYFFSTYVLKENIHFSGSMIIPINRSDAKNKITVNLVNESGNTFSLTDTQYVYSLVDGIFSKTGEAILYSMYGGFASNALVCDRYISDVSSKYSFGYLSNIYGDNHKIYTYRTLLDSGITSSRNITFTDADIHKVDMRYDIDSKITPSIFPVTWNSIREKTNLLSMTMIDENAKALQYPYLQPAYFFGNISSNFPIYQYKEAYKY